MANPGRIDLELIEVQTGLYLAKTILSGSRMSITVADKRRFESAAGSPIETR
jgi:hypothetical protein